MSLVTEEDQFLEKIRTFQALMFNAEDIVELLNTPTTPGKLTLLVGEELRPDAIEALSVSIEDSYEAAFEYANARAKTPEPSATKWQERVEQLDRIYEHVGTRRDELREAQEIAKRTDHEGIYVVLGEGPVYSQDEFLRQGQILGGLLGLAKRVATEPITVLEEGSEGLLDAAERIAVVRENLCRYVAGRSLDSDDPDQASWLFLDATFRVFQPRFERAAKALTDLSVQVSYNIEFPDGEYDPEQ
jgi:hypothetical protein